VIKRIWNLIYIRKRSSTRAYGAIHAHNGTHARHNTFFSPWHSPLTRFSSWIDCSPMEINDSTASDWDAALRTRVSRSISAKIYTPALHTVTCCWLYVPIAYNTGLYIYIYIYMRIAKITSGLCELLAFTLNSYQVFNTWFQIVSSRHIVRLYSLPAL